MLLLDSNVILEIIPSRAGAGEAAQVLRSEHFSLSVSEFSLGTVCYFVGKQRDTRHFDALRVLVMGRVTVRQLSIAENLVDVPAAMQQYRLDFDDAYQYTVAEKHDLTIVSFDHDFDRTPRGRRTPADILNAT